MEGLTQAQIAERLGVKQPAVSKLFRGATLHPGISDPDTLAPATNPKPERTAPETQPKPAPEPEPLDDE